MNLRSEETAPLITQTPGIWRTLTSWRFVIVLIVCLGLVNEYSLRSKLSLALICMSVETISLRNATLPWQNETYNVNGEEVSL